MIYMNDTIIIPSTGCPVTAYLGPQMHDADRPGYFKLPVSQTDLHNICYRFHFSIYTHRTHVCLAVYIKYKYILVV